MKDTIEVALDARHPSSTTDNVLYAGQFTFWYINLKELIETYFRL